MSRSIIVFIGGSDEDYQTLRSVSPENYEIIHAPTANDGLLVYQTCFTKTKLIFIDRDLENLSLPELVKDIHDISVLPELVVFSQALQTQSVIDAMGLGVRDYITAPFDAFMLKQLIRLVEDDYTNLKKIENLARGVMIDELDAKMTMIQELMRHRQSEGKPLTKNEISAFFSENETKRDTMTELIHSILHEDAETHSDDSNKASVLIVEDEKQLQSSIEKKLRRVYETATADTGESALHYLSENPTTDLVLLDIGLPDMSGLDVLKKLKETYPSIEVVMLTAYQDAAVVVQSFRSHACDYITKPFQGELLFSKLSHALQRRYFRKALPDIGKAGLSEKLAIRDKLSILDDIAYMRKERQKPLLLKDIYLFFPELREKGPDETTEILPEELEDGLLLYIETLSSDS